MSSADLACDARLPTRSAGLERLAAFVPRAAADYQRDRNYDRGPDRRENVSMLSPWIRHRLVTEAEVVAETLRHHSLPAAEKFVQEVCWRTYWKGWLEARPAVWDDYRADLENRRAAMGADRWLAARVEAALAGETDIVCFDAWANELRRTGYLHNHARMWFASIWVFTLDLPWELGADFFLRHLLDGDPAVNTLSWRWVAGLQTRGKHYFATANNIAKFTDGRFDPRGQLATVPPAAPEVEHPAPESFRTPRTDTAAEVVWLLTDDDLHAEDWLDAGLAARPLDVRALDTTAARSPEGAAEPVRHFTHGALRDAVARGRSKAAIASEANAPVLEESAAIVDWAVTSGARSIVVPFATVGPNRTAIASLETAAAARGLWVTEVLRPWDRAFWPHATRGFFQLKKQIPAVLDGLGSATRGRTHGG